MEQFEILLKKQLLALTSLLQSTYVSTVSNITPELNPVYTIILI